MIIDAKELVKQTGCDYYDGRLIHSRFAYNFLRDKISPTGDIIIFRSQMRVESAGMIDKEDLISNDFIYSQDAINFCWEVPNLTPLGAVCFQRLFNTTIASILGKPFIHYHISVDGDDIFIYREEERKGILQHKGKCSVSITYSNNNVAIGHTGINVTAGREAPAIAISTNLSDRQVEDFMHEVNEQFYIMTKDLYTATAKLTL